MAGRHFKIDKYQYHFYSSTGFGIRAKMILFGENGAAVATINFVGDPNELPASTKNADGTFSLYYKFSDQPVLMDLLRNESPIYLLAAGEGEIMSISTSREPVGEGELPVLPPPAPGPAP